MTARLIVAAAFLLTVTQRAHARQEPPASFVACAPSGCSTTRESLAGAEFVWVWSAAAPPQRATAADTKQLVGGALRAGDSHAIVHVEPRGEAALQIISAPLRMWREVPEALLPRYDVPKNGTLKLPRTRGVAWQARLVGPAVGSQWVSLDVAKMTVTPVEAATRKLRVTDANGAPLANAGVTLALPRFGDTHAVAAQHRSDRRGMIELESLPTNDPVTLITTAEQHVPDAITGRPADLPDVIVLRRGAHVIARFVDAADKPLKGVRVRAEAWLSGSGVVVSREAVSDAKGAWRIEALPSGTRAVIAATAAGFAPLRKEVELERSLDLGPLVLQRSTTLSVRAIDDSDGRPVGAVRVTGHLLREAVTDEKGVARLSDVSPSAGVEVSLNADGYLPAKVQLSPPYAAAVDIELTRAFTVTGRFTDANGGEIPGATARVLIGSSSHDVPLDGGAFRLPLPPDEQVTIELASSATRVTRLDVEGARGETRDLGTIQAESGAAVRGHLLTADGTPVTAASIWTPRVTEAGTVAAWATGNVVRAQPDTEGAFVLRGAGPEPALIRIDAPGFARILKTVTFESDGRDVDLGSIVVARGATVTVLGRSGISDAIARIALRPESADVDMLAAAMRGGVATIRNVPHGRAVVSLLRDRSTICQKEVEIAVGEELVEVDCSAGATRVRGTVLLGGRPADGGTLTWSSPHDMPVAGVIMNDVSRLGAIHQRPFGVASEVVVQVDADGTFDTEDLRAGEWLVRWTSQAGAMTAPHKLVVEERPEVQVVVRYDASGVRGVVVDEHGLPVKRATVRQMNGDGFALTADDGTFAIAGLVAGQHRFRAEGERGMRSATAVVELEANREAEPLRLVLSKEGADALRVIVNAAHGGPAGSALVFVEAASGETRIVTTAADGRAAVSFDDGVPASVRAAAIHDGAWVFGEWRPTTTLREGLTLSIGQNGTLAVTSEAAGECEIRGPHGWDVRMLLRRMGAVPFVEPSMPLHVSGLPPGMYDVSVGADATHATVRRGETTTVTFRR